MVAYPAPDGTRAIHDLNRSDPVVSPNKGTLLPPSRDAERTRVRPIERVPRGLDGFYWDLVGQWASRRAVSRRIARQASETEASVRRLEDVGSGELKRRVREVRERVRRLGSRWTEGAREALPLVAEMARRELGLRPYATQLGGALAIVEGRLVEMATGEGKTLTIALAATIAGWSGKPCHVITANDYLAGRDARTLNPLFKACGLTVGSIQAQMEPAERRAAYRSAIVYTTGKELVADHLRDRIALGVYADASRRAVLRLQGGSTGGERTVTNGLFTAIIDEVDNQLIDEAVTPLIISRSQPNAVLETACREATRLAASLLPGEHYTVDERYREIRLAEEGKALVRDWSEGRRGFLGAADWVADMVRQALYARHFYLKDRQYVMVDGKVVIVDEFTGRQMPGRTWRLGLHQAIEAKESVETTPPTETIARLSFQEFYRYFHHLAGITGTGREAAGEFWRIYRLPLAVIQRHRPNIRIDRRTRYFDSEAAKWEAIVEEIEREHRAERPILVGTRSVAASERLATRLADRGLNCTVLNAVRHDQEAAVISRAGERGSITIATNMAGRGTDILLGEGVTGRGGLHVILTEGHESKRIDRQLRGRAARQGDPGSSALFVSLEDELIRRHLPSVWLSLDAIRRRGRLPIPLAWWGWLVLRKAQRRAEYRSRRQRFLVLKQDEDLVKATIGGRVGL